MDESQFRAMWLQIFAKDISQDDINKYVTSTGNLIWHVFSWNLTDKKKYSVGEAAKSAFNKEDKEGALYLDWFQDEPCKTITRDLDCAGAFDNFVEVYVVAKDWSWTYIKTHEPDFGPYFMKINQ